MACLGRLLQPFPHYRSTQHVFQTSFSCGTIKRLISTTDYSRKHYVITTPIFYVNSGTNLSYSAVTRDLSFLLISSLTELLCQAHEEVRKPPRAIFAVNLHVDLLVNLLRNHKFTCKFHKFHGKIALPGFRKEEIVTTRLIGEMPLLFYP